MYVLIVKRLTYVFIIFSRNFLIYKKIDNSTYLFDGEIPIYEVEKILGVDLPEGDYDTLSGYLLFELNRIPEDDEKDIIVETSKVNYKIEKIEGNRIINVKACKI